MSAGKPVKRRTTVRIPEELYTLLRIAAAKDNTTHEAIFVEALQRELERRKHIEIRELKEIPNEFNATLAEIFLQFLPTPCAIKDRNGRIIWVNFSYERLCRMSLEQLKDKTLKDVGLVDYISEESEERIENDIKNIFATGKPRELYEDLVIDGQERILFRAQLFRFGDENQYLGDISFNEQNIFQHEWTINSKTLNQLRKTSLSQEIKNLFVPFLEAANISAAIKEVIGEGYDSKIIWANKEYQRLTNENVEKVIGNTTKNVFELKPGDTLLMNDQKVFETKVALFDKVALPGRSARWSLRFPLLDDWGKVKFLGVVSPDFQHAESSIFKSMTSA